jgi:TonB-dependent receptor
VGNIHSGGAKTRGRALRIIALAGVSLPAAAQAADQYAETSAAPSGVELTQDEPAESAEAPAGEEIVVTGSRAAREDAIERKRQLPTIADVIASDDIGKLPDFNTAEALQRLPGISVQIDQGEPRYVVVRGIDPNLNQVTIDGNLVGIPEAEGRRVALDTIPSDIVFAIEVVKAVTPDYDANAIGGSINLITPTAFDRAGPFTFATARGTYNDKSGKVGFGGSVTHGQRFGPDGQFGLVVAGSYLKRFIDSDLAEPTGYQTFATGEDRLIAPTSFVLFDYRIMRERIGAILNLDWRPDDNVRVYVRNIYNEFTDEEERDQFNISLMNGAPAPTVLSSSQISYRNARATRQFRQNNQTQKLYNISPGVELRLGAAELDLNYAYAHAQEHTPLRDDLEFRTAANRTATLDVSTPLPVFVALDPTLFNPAAYPLRRIRQRREKIDEDLNAFRADLKIPFADDEKTFFKAGGKYIKRVKERDNSQTQRDALGTSTFAGTGAGLPPIDDFYKGAYEFGPAIDYQAVLVFYAANPNLIAVNALQTAINERALDYRINEKIYAGYGMVSLALGNLTAIGGVRAERTDGRYSAFAIRSGGTAIEPLSFDRKYTHVLPSVHLNYQAARDVLLRAAWTNTLGRPNYDASVPTFTEDNGVGTAGNPNLKPYTSMGLDFSAEYYPGADSILSLGIFYKDLKNPIFTQQIQNTTFAGVPLTRLSQPQNATSGELFGIEVNAQTRFTFLPAPFDGFGASVNGTYVDSQVEVPGREDEDIPFFRQSKWIANAALFYEKAPFEARVALSYRSPFIENVGSPTQGTAADIYQYGRTVVDARMSYKVTQSIEVFGSLSNINEAPLNYYQTKKRQTYAREIYSFNGDFGVSVRF